MEPLQMASRRIPANAYYVYALYREDGITPFYIGKGGADRWMCHEARAWRAESHKDRLILKMRAAGCLQVPKAKLAENLTDLEAKALEIELIAKIGRVPNGPLINETSGGDGIVNISPEALARRTASILKAAQDPVVAARHKAAGKRRAQAPGFAQKISASIKKAFATKPELKQMRSRVMKKAWAKNHAARCEAIAAGSNTPEAIQRKSDVMKKKWQDPEARKRMIDAVTPEVRARMSAAMTKAAKNPRRRAQCSDAGKKGAEARWGKKT